MELDASTAPAKRPGNPARFIMGMVMTPVEAVLATADPEMVPVRPEASTATSPGPPTNRPAAARDRSMMYSPAPERTRNAPKIMNRKTYVELMLAIVPNKAKSP